MNVVSRKRRQKAVKGSGSTDAIMAAYGAKKQARAAAIAATVKAAKAKR